MHVQLTCSCRGNALTAVQEAPSSILVLARDFMFASVCILVFYFFLSKTNYLGIKFCNAFGKVNSFSLPNILPIL